ncbi:hypothetical protein GCM10010975_22670 [Comamonas phosphati]|nr:hypothetical protein GCM10010975_22670 [Comamonas phosphati]
MSMVPPGGAGTMSLMGWAAQAVPQARAQPASSARVRRFISMSPFLYGLAFSIRSHRAADLPFRDMNLLCWDESGATLSPGSDTGIKCKASGMDCKKSASLLF